MGDCRQVRMVVLVPDPMPESFVDAIREDIGGHDRDCPYRNKGECTCGPEAGKLFTFDIDVCPWGDAACEEYLIDHGIAYDKSVGAGDYGGWWESFRPGEEIFTVDVDENGNRLVNLEAIRMARADATMESGHVNGPKLLENVDELIKRFTGPAPLEA